MRYFGPGTASAPSGTWRPTRFFCCKPSAPQINQGNTQFQWLIRKCCMIMFLWQYPVGCQLYIPSSSFFFHPLYILIQQSRIEWKSFRFMLHESFCMESSLWWFVDANCWKNMKYIIAFDDIGDSPILRYQITWNPYSGDDLLRPGTQEKDRHCTSVRFLQSKTCHSSKSNRFVTLPSPRRICLPINVLLLACVT